MLVLIFSACIEMPKPVLEAGRSAAAAIVVDAFASPGGDGSAQAPLKTFPRVVAVGARFEVRSGLYRGPFVFAPGVELLARGEVVLYAEGLEAVVVEGQGTLTLTGVSIQGGGTGLHAKGDTVLSAVHFSGQHLVALEAEGLVTAKDCELQGLGSTAKGIVLKRGARATLEKVHFTGGFGRAIEVVNASVTVLSSTFEGPRTALHAIDSVSLVRDTHAFGGSGPAFFASRGALTLKAVTVEGHEYAVQAGSGTTLEVAGFTSKRPLMAGFGLVETRAQLTDVTLESSGSMGGIQAIGCDLTLTHSKITDAKSIGVLARKGTLQLDEVRITGVTGEADNNGTRSLGDAVHLRDVTATLKNLTVADVEGSAVFVSAGAKVSIDELKSERAGEGALLVERNAQVEASHVQSAGTLSPAVSVIDGASLIIDSLLVQGSEVPLWAQCNEHVRVTIRSMQPAPQTLKLGPCVTIQPSRDAKANHQ